MRWWILLTWVSLFGLIQENHAQDLVPFLRAAKGISLNEAEIEAALAEIKGLSDDAVVKLGIAYVTGQDGKTKDDRKAVALFLIASARGHLDGQARLGYMYHQGLGVVLDYREAARWIRKSAESGYAKAQYNLGLMYGNGQGVALDTEKALEWLRKSARQGYQEAQNVLKDMDESWE